MESPWKVTYFLPQLHDTFVNGNIVYVNEDNYGKHSFNESSKRTSIAI